MAFSRSKRFPPLSDTNPAVGQYNPASPSKKGSAVIFDKGSRFNDSRYEGLSTCSKHKEIILKLEADLESLKSRLSEEKNVNSNLQIKISELRSEKETIGAECSEKTTAVTKANEERERLQAEIYQNVAKFDNLTSERDELLRVNLEIREIVEDLRNQKKELGSDLAKNELVIMDCCLTIERLEKSLRAKEETCKELQRERSDLQEQNKTQFELVSNVKEENIKNLLYIDDLKLQLKLLAEERDGICRIIAEKDSTISDLTAQIDHIRAQLAEKDSTVKTLQSDLTEQIDKLRAKEACLAKVTDELAVRTESLDKVQNQMREMEENGKNQEMNFEQMLRATNEELENTKLDSNTQLSELELYRNTNKDLTNTVTTLNSEKLELLNVKEIMESQSKRTSEELEQMRGVIDRLKKEANPDDADIRNKLKHTQMTLCFTTEQLDSKTGECDKWMTQYQELYERVLPFMSQIEEFEAEKKLLLDRNEDSARELAKLARDYANILGHQNNKQKIKHVVQLKDEIISLKKEVSTLREKDDGHRRTIRRLKDQLCGSGRAYSKLDDTKENSVSSFTSFSATPRRRKSRSLTRLTTRNDGGNYSQYYIS